jgi:hypothetical protein
MESLKAALEASIKECPKDVAVLDRAGRFALWEQIVGRIKPQAACEIGVWQGEFAAHLLKTCNAISTYYMIDPWRNLPDWNKPLNVDNERFDLVYRTAMDNTSFARDKVKVLRDRTVDAVDKIPDQSLDFVYVDGDHTLRGIAVDLIAIWPKVKPGGYVGGDDLAPTIWRHTSNFEPTLVYPFAVYFAEAMRAPVFALPYEQFLMQKPLSGGQHEFVRLAPGYEDPTLKNQIVPINGMLHRVPSIRQLVPGSFKKFVRRVRSAVR